MGFNAELRTVRSLATGVTLSDYGMSDARREHVQELAQTLLKAYAQHPDYAEIWVPCANGGFGTWMTPHEINARFQLLNRKLTEEERIARDATQ
jgi:hypothetical protein